ncbi:hypothetical protein N0V93_004868 [Gnomoniopsis smithogilvyi]|uniref:Ankyrin n=1 Tax=Gnomoniopsis smithogilvyi TaxID=1191159 RepID=A0A9W9CXK6_9PEZI|nr:hypothetical protein N0V93_004868 [Gnomoniopsis smithogilvyi]
MSLQDLPSEIRCNIIEHLINTIGPFKAVNVRLVSRCFDAAFLTTLTTRQAIDFEDPALRCGLWHMLPGSLKARAMMARAKRLGASPTGKQDKSLSFLVDTIESLDELMEVARSEQVQEQRGLMIAEAAAHFYFGSRADLKLFYDNGNNLIAHRSQNTLCGAIILGNLSLVQALLRDRTDIDVNIESACFGLPLHLASAWGHVAIFQHLLNSGANPNALSHEAEEIDHILDHNPGSGQHIHSPKGSALSAAAGSGHEIIVQKLLSLPLDRRDRGTSPEYSHAIISATRGGHIGCIELLVRATGRPLAELPNALHEQMLWAAARGGYPNVVSLLLDDPQLQLDVNTQRLGRLKNGSALHLAAARGDTALATLLVERYGADVDLESYEHGVGCPYEIAARAGHRETLEFLLTASGDEHAVTRAFQSAARGAQLGILAWLLARYGREIAAIQAYPDMAASNNDTVGQVALVRAIVDPAPGVILFLVREAHVSLNEGFASLGGMLPVAVAKTESSRWVVDLLLRLGAEDVTVDEDHLRANSSWESFTTEEGPLYTIRGVRVSERTWQWV